MSPFDALGLLGKRKIIEAVCAITDDETTLQIAKWWEMEPNGRAAEFLNHYLGGTGSTKIVPLQNLLKDDRKLASYVTEEIRHKIPNKIASGTVPVAQTRYSSKDWKFALGSININWTLQSQTKTSAMISLGFRNEYRWHPKADRISQCVHQAADDLKVQGAKDFFMEGKARIEIDLRESSKILNIYN